MRRIVVVIALAACGTSEPRTQDDDGLPDRDFTVVLASRARDAAEQDRNRDETARALGVMADTQGQIEALARSTASGATTLDALIQAQWAADRAEANARLSDLRRRRVEMLRMVDQERILERSRRRKWASGPAIY